MDGIGVGTTVAVRSDDGRGTPEGLIDGVVDAPALISASSRISSTTTSSSSVLVLLEKENSAPVLAETVPSFRATSAKAMPPPMMMANPVTIKT